MRGLRSAWIVIVEAASVAAACGGAGWLDALWVSHSRTPRVPWGEVARLAGRDAVLLLIPAAATLALALVLSLLLSRRSAEPGVPLARSRKVIAGWAAALVVLALCGFNPKVGWLAGSLLMGLLAAWLTGSAGRRLLPVEPPRSAMALPIVALLILWVPIGLLGRRTVEEAGDRGPAADAGGRPNFILVVVDALRADHLGTYGYARATSPAIDALAQRGVRFDDVVAPSSWTLPSMSSILTSTYPGQHGAVEKGSRLPADLAKLPALLRASGYRTAAFTTNPWLKRPFGFDDGFEEYFDLDRLSLEDRLLGVRLKNLVLRRLKFIRLDPELVPVASEVTRRAEDWLRHRPAGPFFLYVHYMDVHAPYLPIPKYRGRFCPGHRFDLPDRFLESRFRAGSYKDNPEVLAHVEELYDEDLLATDESIGVLLETVSRIGLEGNTTIVFAADHGEEFYEHGETTHGHNLHRETVHVPLLIASPDRRAVPPGHLSQRVSSLDIFPTILEMAGVDRPKAIEGRSLVPMMRGVDDEGEGGARVIGSQLVVDGRAWSALYVGNDKIIRVRPPADDPAARSVTMLYRTDEDPGERHDLSASDPETVARLAGSLEALEKVWGIAGRGGKRPGEKVDRETLEQLKALGYIN